MMKYLSNIAILILATVFLSGCETVTSNQTASSADEIYGFKKVLVKGGDFLITTYQRIDDKNAPFTFYIEGDGAAFNGKFKISNNPTPKKQMFISLAAMDKRPNVVYIARPCQYTPMHLNPKCSNQYWTNKRMSEDSVLAINDVINSINNKQKFSLIGYSGGGGIAILIAARNHMVSDIITVAGNLDHQAFTTHHHVTPMKGSLNPIDYVTQVRNIPQLHISGGKDTIIPPFIADKFVQKASSPCVKQQIFASVSHRAGWKEMWEYIYIKPIKCYD